MMKYIVSMSALAILLAACAPSAEQTVTETAGTRSVQNIRLPMGYNPNLH
jgi:PBP1b-binding outer membrane lipoprotein LpoB